MIGRRASVARRERRRRALGQGVSGLIGRGFLRAYAREVGLDPASVVRQFQDQFEDDDVERIHRMQAPQPSVQAKPLTVVIEPTGLCGSRRPSTERECCTNSCITQDDYASFQVR